jgi:hypothetical protein
MLGAVYFHMTHVGGGSVIHPLQDEVSPSEAYEHSELLAYKAMVLQEGGQAEAALMLLEQQQVSTLCKRLRDCSPAKLVVLQAGGGG